MMAEAMGEKCKVYAVDHIEELMDFALCNIIKNHSELLNDDRIEFIIKDGRKGLAKHGPYDVIHVGAASEKMINELID